MGTAINISAAAGFRRGTRILTDKGEVPIELLTVGAMIATKARIMRPIRWIGRRHFPNHTATGNRDVLPVLIRQGAIAKGVPRRDLWVSPELAMFMDGMLIPARGIVNGATITQEEEADDLSYFHLEFDAHHLIVAERALGESYVEDDNRDAFDNAAEYALLYPEAVRKPARYCAPRGEEGDEVEAIRRRLRARAGLPTTPGPMPSAAVGLVGITVRRPVAPDVAPPQPVAPPPPAAPSVVRKTYVIAKSTEMAQIAAQLAASANATATANANGTAAAMESDSAATPLPVAAPRAAAVPAPPPAPETAAAPAPAPVAALPEAAAGPAAAAGPESAAGPEAVAGPESAAAPETAASAAPGTAASAAPEAPAAPPPSVAEAAVMSDATVVPPALAVAVAAAPEAEPETEAEPEPEPALEVVQTSWQGFLDSVRRERVDGWAQDDEHPDLALKLRILDNGASLGEVKAGDYRADLAAAGIGDGRHAFSFRVPGGLEPGTRHLIEVIRADDGRHLRGSPLVFEASSDVAPAAMHVALPARWRGKIEVATRERIEGWAWDNHSDEPVALMVLDNGEVMGRLLANRYRPELANLGAGSGMHGFSMLFPGGLSPLIRHVIQVIGEADGCEMPSSPVVIEAATSFDAALERAIAGAVSALDTEEERSRVLAFLATQVDHLLQLRANDYAQRETRLIHRQFERRWGNTAASAGAPPEPRPRALLIDDFMPVADPSGKSAPILSHLHALQALGYAVSFVAAEALSADPAASEALEAQGVQVCESPYYASVEEVLRRQHDCFEVIYLHRVSNAAKYLSLARRYAKQARIVYAVGELHHLRLARQAKIEGRADLLTNSHQLRRAECAAAGAADVVVTHSVTEATWLRHAVPNANVHVVPWVVPAAAVATPWQERSGIAFLGDFGNAADIDAARHLIADIMPRVWAQDATIECHLAGSFLPAPITRLQSAKVLMEPVADPATLFERVRLTVAPQRYGAGVKATVLASLAAGVPCVVSAAAADGLDLPAALAAAGATADEIAAQILKVYAANAGTGVGDPARAALAFVAERFSETAVSDGLRFALSGIRASGGAAKPLAQISAKG